MSRFGVSRGGEGRMSYGLVSGRMGKILVSVVVVLSMIRRDELDEMTAMALMRKD